MFKYLTLFVIVATAVAKPSHSCEPLQPCHHQVSHHRFSHVVPAPPCETPCVEKELTPCVDEVITTVDAPVVEEIIPQEPVVEKIITSCPEPHNNRVITPVNVPTTISHTYRREIINEPVLSSYPATVPILSKTVYTTPYYPIAPCPAPLPAHVPAHFSAHYPAHLPAHFPAQFPAHLPAHFPAQFPAHFPALSAFPGNHYFPHHAHHHGHHGVRHLL